MHRRSRSPRAAAGGSWPDWLAQPDNPLTARVMVNRIWQHHFGEGLVRTPNDFGNRGERPSNPELLDWLAARFVESGWSVKAMHRLIMLSSTYQQSSRADAGALARDPENRLFGRMNRRRLEAEAIRDSLLAVAGRLDAAMGGPSFADLAVPRRTLYLQSVRTGPSASDFGRAVRSRRPRLDRRPARRVGRGPAGPLFPERPVRERAGPSPGRAGRPRGAGERTRRGSAGSTPSPWAGRRPPPRARPRLANCWRRNRGTDAWERYCQLIVCQNEFLYID